MKKLMYFLIIITVTIACTFSVILTQYRSWYDFYDSYTRVEIEFPRVSNNAVDVQQLFKDLQAFSDEYQINIMQMHFTDSETTVNIFASNLIYDDNFSLHDSELLQGDSTNQMVSESQVFSFNTMWSTVIEAQFFELSHVVQHHGISGQFMLGGGLEYAELFSEAFSYYGAIMVQENFTGVLLPGILSLSLAMMNSGLLAGLIFMTITTFIIIVLYLLRLRKRLFLNFLWGIPKYEALLSIPKEIGLFQLKVIAISLIFMFIYLLLQQQLFFLIDYLITFLTVQGSLLLLIVVFSLCGNLLIVKAYHITESMKGRSFAPKLSFFIFLSKPIFTVLLFYITLSAYVDFQRLTEIGNGDSWEGSEEVMGLGFFWNPDLLYRDPQHEMDMHRRFTDFYTQIKAENDAFIISSVAFDRLNPSCVPEEFFYLGCNVLIVDASYLMRHNISTVNGENVLDFLLNDENTLNILVPIDYQSFEAEMFEYYMAGFLEQRRSRIRTNMIIAEEEQIVISEDMLTINFIYKESQQFYFTYNHWTGNVDNQVEDPIVMVMTDGLSHEFIANTMASSLFFVDETRRGIESLVDVIQMNELVELRFASSVYNQRMDFLRKEQARLTHQVISGVVVSSMIVFLQTGFIWTIYQAQAHRFTLHHLFGFPFWQINKRLFKITIFAYFLLLLSIYLIQNLGELWQLQIGRFFWFILGMPVHFDWSFSTIIIGVTTLFILELSLIYVIGKKQMKLNTEKTLKGEYL